MKQNLPHSFIELLFDKLDPDQFMSLFLDALTSVQKVERGSLWIKRGDGYVCTVACGAEAEKVQGFILSKSQKSIVGTVIETGQMTIAEAGKDERHFKGVDRILDTKNTLILCFPLAMRDGSVYGAVEILDTTAHGSRLNLDPDYLELLQSIVTVGGIALSAALHLADQLEKSDNMKGIRNRFLSHPLMIGQSEKILKVMETARIYASNDFPVMITGESGTGKEILAGQIHRLSSRKNKPFLVQNCSAIPATLLESELFGYVKGAFTGAEKDKMGLFEAADGGSLFLDEVGDMPLDLQAKILRVLQSHEIKPLGSTLTHKVDVRIISATNKNLSASLEKGEFRHDLYYRLNVLPLKVPPIRDRKEDIPLLFIHFMKQFSQGLEKGHKTITPEAMETLVHQPWPGNIREIENLAKYLITVIDGDEVRLSDLPPPYSRASRTPGDPESAFRTSQSRPTDLTAEVGAEDQFMESVEKKHILSLLERTRWNVTAAAELAGMKRTTFSSRMKKHGIRKKG